MSTTRLPLRKTKSLQLLLTTAVLLAGCATTKMVEAPDQTFDPVRDENRARVVFLRSSFVGSAIQASIYDVTGGDPEFIGIISSGMRLAHEVDAGSHVFMVVSEAADFMEANLSGGLTYYAVVTPRMGAWRARFSMWPVRNGQPGEFDLTSDRFAELLEKTRLVTNTAESEQWFVENAASVRDKQTRYWEVWQQKSPSDLAERTLNPADGVRVPLGD